MWYLNRGDRLDMNVQGAWLEGVTGKGVSITILDDGVERSHPDLQATFMKIMFHSSFQRLIQFNLIYDPLILIFYDAD